jgi:hypothetical protein
MVIITYVKPYLIINSDELLTGLIIIRNGENKIIKKKEIVKQNFENIKVSKKEGDMIKVELITAGLEIKKQFRIN